MNNPINNQDCYNIVDKYGLNRNLCDLNPDIYKNELNAIEAFLNNINDIKTIYDDEENQLKEILTMIDSL